MALNPDRDEKSDILFQNLILISIQPDTNVDYVKIHRIQNVPLNNIICISHKQLTKKVFSAYFH
jgi:hypothetical protein